MKTLMWHVHGSWSTAFVASGRDVVVPVTPERDEQGLGRPTTYVWPDTATEIASTDIDAVDAIVLQRVQEIEWLEQWSGIRAGVDVPAVYVEHNAPTGHAANSRHPLADQERIPIVHVTAFNALMWDNGQAPVRVIEHGIPDPGHRYTGSLPRVATAINEPVRRQRITGTDLLPAFAEVASVDVFGMGSESLNVDNVIGHGDVSHSQMHGLLAMRRVYLHLSRWTSLGLSLLEAMYLGMPVVCLSTTQAPEALAASSAVVSNDMDILRNAVREYVHDPQAALQAGRLNRAAVAANHHLDRFTSEWDALLKEVIA